MNENLKEVASLEIISKEVLHTLAAKVNSRSSLRKVLSSIAIEMTSLRRSSLRNRYSVTPSQIRNSFESQ